MKKVLILSGKGGTGKTTVAAAFISIEKAHAFADCDVDAPNLHLVTASLPEPELFDYYGMGVAVVDPDLCIGCGLCAQSCRFYAISMSADSVAVVDAPACEGCGLCERLCPVGAIKTEDNVAGRRMLYTITEEVNKDGASPSGKRTVFSTAELEMGSGTTGKLVSEVKKALYDHADKDVPIAIIDGSPGIGCPVIASITGTDLVLIVAEPSVSGISDMKRIVETARFFDPQIAVCVNKADTNEGKTEDIIRFCAQEDLPFLGRIPFDSHVTGATNAGTSIDRIDCPASTAIRAINDRVRDMVIGESPVNDAINERIREMVHENPSPAEDK